MTESGSRASSRRHDPKNATQAEAVRHELADVLAYLLRLADVLQVDLATALPDKTDLNARRYPIDRSRGHSDRYDAYGN
ncbi:MazG-like family protein [Micromonospora humi]|uniref:MazG-like family protein n=1 Tax=Micromonospora humi TaxID=745366 RepID=UPI003CCC3C93